MEDRAKEVAKDAVEIVIVSNKGESSSFVRSIIIAGR